MITRIEVYSKIPDTRANVVKKKLHSLGFTPIKTVSMVDVYTIDKAFNQKELEKIASMLSNPVTQRFTIGSYTPQKSFSWAVEVGFLPGVTDNVAATTKEGIEDLFKCKFATNEGVYTSQLFLFEGRLNKEEAAKISQSLTNPLIQRIHIKHADQFKKDGGMDKVVPKVKLHTRPKADEVNLNVDDEELKIIGKQGIANKDSTRRGPLALDLTYMKTIQDYFRKKGRNPTDVELESIAQTWSEHCKHTIFADPIDNIKDGLFKTYIKKATEEVRKKKAKSDFCVSIFTDNSGAIKFDDDYLITHKVETHNSPSALDPFGGSITGIVGVNRDTLGFGLGAKPVANVYGFCFADPNDKTVLYRDKQKNQQMLSPRRIMDGVIAGVNSGGNCSGIPTPQGFLFFDKGYIGKPLVFCGTVGLIPKKKNGKVLFKKKAKAGDYIVMMGGRVGIDGIHGATFSSEALDSGSPATAVQIGDTITQKKLSDALVNEARDLGLYHSITDNGAGGLSCSVAEMAKESGGCLVHLESVPLKYPGLKPWQIWISESQERMTLAVPKNKWQKFADLMKRRGVETTVIGTFTNSGKCVVKYGNEMVMNIDMDFLHYGLPKRPMQTFYTLKKISSNNITQPKNLTTIFLDMLKRLNIAGYSFLSQQYDHTVQSGSVVMPLIGRGRINGEATVIRPVLESKRGVVLSQGLYPFYSNHDPYRMAAASIDTAIRNVVSVGADPEKVALLDNFCWCSSNDPYRLGQLKEAVRACYDVATSYGTPFISGKDSMFNDFKGFDQEGNPIVISIPPTLLISSIAVLDDYAKAVTLDAKFPGDLIYILGETYDELGCSEYDLNGREVPRVDASKNKNMYKALFKAISKGLISSSISVTRGGVGIALAKMAMAGMLGIDISLLNLPGNTSRDDFALFSESQGRVVITINPKDKKNVETLFKGISIAQIGVVRKDNRLTIRDKNNKTIIKTDVEIALHMYRLPFKDF